MPGDQGLINKTYTTESGTDVKKTKQISGQAKEGADWNSKNETKEYVAPDPPTSGPLGGKAVR